MTAHLYLATVGYMVFDTGKSFLKFVVPTKLIKINSIKTYDDGCLVMDTNYGDEYIDLKAIAEEINININFDDIKNLALGKP